MTYEFDGARFSTLEGFFEEVSTVLIPGVEWGRNENALLDVLRGGFGTPPDGFTILWRNHRLSRQRLGYPETARQLEAGLRHCLRESRDNLRRMLQQAHAREGPTVFDSLIEIIRDEEVKAAGVELILA
jgi:hypothetical protein